MSGMEVEGLRNAQRTLVALSAVQSVHTNWLALEAEEHDRKQLEQLCRYITRPALSDQRVQLNATRQVKPSFRR